MFADLVHEPLLAGLMVAACCMRCKGVWQVTVPAGCPRDLLLAGGDV